MGDSNFKICCDKHMAVFQVMKMSNVSTTNELYSPHLKDLRTS